MLGAKPKDSLNFLWGNKLSLLYHLICISVLLLSVRLFPMCEDVILTLSWGVSVSYSGRYSDDEERDSTIK